MDSTNYDISGENGVYFIAGTIENSKSIVEEVRSTDHNELLAGMQEWCKDLLADDLLRVVSGWAVLHKSAQHLLNADLLRLVMHSMDRYALRLYILVSTGKRGYPNAAELRDVGANIARRVGKSSMNLSEMRLVMMQVLAASEHIIGEDNHYAITSYLSCVTAPERSWCSIL